MLNNEHPTRPGHIRVQFSETDDRMTCTHPSHELKADANACAFDAMWTLIVSEEEEEVTGVNDYMYESAFVMAADHEQLVSEGGTNTECCAYGCWNDEERKAYGFYDAHSEFIGYLFH